MWEQYFSTRSIVGKGYDILYCNTGEKYFEVFLNAPSKDSATEHICFDTTYLSRQKFETKICEFTKQGLFNAGTIDASGHISNRYQLFYTDSKNHKSCTQIEIDIKEKTFLISLDIEELPSKYDIFDHEIDSTYMIRESFDMLVLGVKSNGYTEIKQE